MHGRKLPQIFLGILSFLLCASLARAAYWKFAVPFGGGSDSAMSVAKSQKYEKIDRHFIELKMALANEAQFRKPASEKINIMKAKLVEFNEIRKSQEIGRAHV